MSAVLLAGGKSTRMGRDKAAVEFRGWPLWQRQVTTLAALNPRALFISGKADGPYVDSGAEVIPDLYPDSGPLGGLEAACRRMETTLLCVLAIDLPWMTPEFLARLVDMALEQGCGVVPRNGDRFEPLAAVYPYDLLRLIHEHLRKSDLSLQRLVQRAIELQLVVPYSVTEEERALFRNVNTPEDLQ